MKLSERINAFALLSNFFTQFSVDNQKDSNYELIEINNRFYERLTDLIKNVINSNGWFTEEYMRFALASWGKLLEKENLNNWCKMYSQISDNQTNKNIGVVTAGNIPMVGFHDLLCVLISGNNFAGKFSSKDDKLMMFIIELLCFINQEFTQLISVEEYHLTANKKIDAIIATGSNNSARYFEYYFSKYPNIIRKNRNSVAILNGNESEQQLENLADDVFLYFGLGCRNVSKIYIPNNYDFTKLIRCFSKFESCKFHTKYANNIDYHKSIYLLNRVEFLDYEFVMLKEDRRIASPISVLFYEKYTDKTKLIEQLEIDLPNLQCISVSNTNDWQIAQTVIFGETQKPKLWDYADNVDTMQFLIDL